MNANMDLERRYQEALNLFREGDTHAAEKLCHALLREARLAGVLYLLGLCQLQQGRAQEAIGSFLEALKLVPDNPQFLHYMGQAYSRRGEWLAAAQAYTRAIDLDPGQPENYLYLGPIYEQVGDMDSAERAYRRALELNPRLATAAASLASMYEKANRLEEADRLVETALEQDSGDHVANLVRAQLDYRKGGYTDAVERLNRLLLQRLSPWNRAITAGRLGAAYDKLGSYANAFAAFDAGKKALLDAGLGATETGMYSLQTIESVIRRYMDTLLAQKMPPARVSADTPVFLVGFPRSGTTLLDQILSSHPGIVVQEEKGILQQVLKEFITGDEGIARLTSLDQASRATLQKRYWQYVEKNLGEPLGSRLLVDKLPLYTIFMPVIRHIFPAAHFIFAVRDPRDVVLSCFMHPFSLNEAMGHFLTLEGTADYYAAVMDIGIASLERMPERSLRLSYEALLEDTEAESRKLCAFLEIEWQEQLLRFYDTASKRRINTPSYHQVVQPIYRSAHGRWRHYAGHLEPIRVRLAPYVKYFGYAGDGGA